MIAQITTTQPTAEQILSQVYAQASFEADRNPADYMAWAYEIYEVKGFKIFAQAEILNCEVVYTVGADPVIGEYYPTFDYQSALRTLRNLMS